MESNNTQADVANARLESQRIKAQMIRLGISAKDIDRVEREDNIAIEQMRAKLGIKH